MNNKFYLVRYYVWFIVISEHIISNLSPVVLSIVAVNAPLSTSWVWFTITIITTLGDHSGYHMPFLHSPEFHDYHHLKFVECFGASGFLDRFHNTCTKFEESVYFLRHKTLFTLTAANELHPDDISNDERKNDWTRSASTIKKLRLFLLKNLLWIDLSFR